MLHRVPVYRINEIPFTKRREAESQGLVKVTWVEGVVLCNTCYMYLVENPLRIGIKRVKVRDEKEASISIRIELTKAIEAIGKILYEREHIEKEGPVYEYDEMRNLLQTKELNLKDFFDRQNVMSRR